MICYFSKTYKSISNAGNKAKTDIEKILQQENIRNIGLPQKVQKNKITGFIYTLISVLKASLCLKQGDILIVQYPLKKYYTFISRIVRLKKACMITLIHDLGSFRRQKLTIAQEIKRLNRSHYIIAHNTAMQKWLRGQNCRVPSGCLEIFDYLSSAPTSPRTVTSTPYTVVYAGALSPRKNKFLYELGAHIQNYHINLYGNGFEADQAQGKSHFTCKGFIPSDELIKNAAGEFGLVWDGDSLQGCAGNWGEYLKYNNPHKTSLYIRCELPVIIWEEAALAPFVKEKGIGICIKNLKDLDRCLAHLSLEEYLQMKKNITAVSRQLAEGYYCKKAIKQAIHTLNPVQ